MLLQHLEKMIGGVIGVDWQIVHRNVSISIFFRPIGTLVLDTSKRLATLDFKALISLAIPSIPSLFLLTKGMMSLSSSEESDGIEIALFVSASRTA